MTVCCQGLRLIFSFSRGLATNHFVGVISLSKNSASNPDVCGSNLYLRGDKGGVQSGAATPTRPHSLYPASPRRSRTVPLVPQRRGGRRKPDLLRAGSLWTCPCSAPPSRWGDSAFHTLPAAETAAPRREEERREHHTPLAVPPAQLQGFTARDFCLPLKSPSDRM